MVKNYLKNLSFIILGCIIMAIGTSMFLLPNKFSTGGVTGIATIVYYLFKIPLGTVNILINILFIFQFSFLYLCVFSYFMLF